MVKVPHKLIRHHAVASNKSPSECYSDVLNCLLMLIMYYSTILSLAYCTTVCQQGGFILKVRQDSVLVISHSSMDSSCIVVVVYNMYYFTAHVSKDGKGCVPQKNLITPIMWLP